MPGPFRHFDAIPHFETEADDIRPMRGDVTNLTIHGVEVTDTAEVGDLRYIAGLDELQVLAATGQWEPLSSSMSIIVAPTLNALRQTPAQPGQVGYVETANAHYGFDGTTWTPLSSQSSLIGLLSDGTSAGTLDANLLGTATPANRGQFYLMTGGDYAPTAGPLAGVTLHAGDTITSTPGAGTNGWSITTGSASMSKSRAVGLFGMRDVHDPALLYELGTLVVDPTRTDRILSAITDIPAGPFDPTDWQVVFDPPHLYVTDVAPTDASEGDNWINNVTGETSRWDDATSAWVAVADLLIEVFPDVATRLDGDLLVWDAAASAFRRARPEELLPQGVNDGEVLVWNQIGTPVDYTATEFGGPIPAGVVDLVTLRADTTAGDAAKVASGDLAYPPERYIEVPGGDRFSWDGTTWQVWIPGGWQPDSLATGDLGDVDLTVAPTDGQVLQWDNVAGDFKPATLSLTGPPVRTLYIGTGQPDPLLLQSEPNNFGLPPGSQPDPVTFPPVGGDCYYDSLASQFYELEGPDQTARVGGTLTGVQDWPVPAGAGGTDVLINVGVVLMFASDQIPGNFLLCDGTGFNATQYPELYAFLGQDTLPDLRNQFIRGATTGRAPLSTQDWATGMPKSKFGTASAGQHTHTFDDTTTSQNESGAGAIVSGTVDTDHQRINDTKIQPNGAHVHTVTGGDSETRPDNVALVFAICARPVTRVLNLAGVKATGALHWEIGDGTDGQRAHLYVSDALNAPTFAGLAPTGWSDLGVVGESMLLTEWLDQQWPTGSIVEHAGMLYKALIDVPAGTAAPDLAATEWAPLLGAMGEGLRMLRSVSSGGAQHPWEVTVLDVFTPAVPVGGYLILANSVWFDNTGVTDPAVNEWQDASGTVLNTGSVTRPAGVLLHKIAANAVREVSASGGGDVSLIRHEGGPALTEVQVDFDWSVYCSYEIEFAMEGAMSTESDSGHQFLGTQTSSVSGSTRYGVGVSANTAEQVLPDGDKVGRLIIGREMNRNRMEMTVTPVANEYISIAGLLANISSATGHLKIINASGWMEVTVTAVKG